ncbi:MAG: alpha/beta hydrolase, partial [Gemmataceae bacterium]
SLGSEPISVSVKAHTNVTFAKIGNEKLLLDLTVPNTPGPHPVVVCIHGGAWKLGDRYDLAWSICGETIIEEMNKAGYAAATIEYRLAPKHKFPAQIEDCKTAVRFLRANAAKYNLDPDRIGALGFSAGAHLACLLGTTGPEAGFDGTLYPDVSSSVRCVLDYFGPSDLTLYSKSEGIVDSYMVPWLGKDAAKSLDIYKKASPITYVSKGDAPTLIVHGTFDVMVPVIHAERYRDKLKAEGVPVDCLFLPGRLHGWRHEDTKVTDAKGIEFLNKYLKPAPVK